MNKGDSLRAISDEDFEIILAHYWEQIALFAFEKYKDSGRGTVILDRHGLAEDILEDQVDPAYVVYEPGCPDRETAKMIDAYDQLGDRFPIPTDGWQS